ncbi:MAG: hypothetical protein HLUCCA08_06020 [Rhodobacteraceae bacterium HLUCCA08]|nr:MAG: hypothetical protein HLUCCA08_06020 [Rhodobacteraceae bacterium HLUCCA08]
MEGARPTDPPLPVARTVLWLLYAGKPRIGLDPASLLDTLSIGATWNVK